MKFEISREELLGPLQKVTGVVEKRQTIPILANVLVKLQNGQLTLTGTDLEVELTAMVEIRDQVDASTTVPARKLLDIIRLMPEQCMISFSIEEGKCRIRSGHSRFVLNTLNAENFPESERTSDYTQFSIESGIFKKAMEKTVFAMAQQDVRYYLNGMLMTVQEQEFELVASDGHRLSFYKQKLEAPSIQETTRIILPRKGVLELYRLLGDTDKAIEIRFSKNSFQASMENVVFSTKLIDAKYPDFKKILTREPIGTLRADRNELRDALARVFVLSNENHRGISVKLDAETMLLSTSNAEHDEAEEEIAIENPQALALSVGFNIQYLLDAVSNVEHNDVVLSFTENAKNCFVDDPSDTCARFVVMPMVI